MKIALPGRAIIVVLPLEQHRSALLKCVSDKLKVYKDTHAYVACHRALRRQLSSCQVLQEQDEHHSTAALKDLVQVKLSAAT